MLLVPPVNFYPRLGNLGFVLTNLKARRAERPRTEVAGRAMRWMKGNIVPRAAHRPSASPFEQRAGKARGTHQRARPCH